VLEEITIKDLGIIKDATLTFTPGLTTITGETGAGKTMVLSALNLLLGKRSEASMILANAPFTSVEGCWRITPDSPVTSLVDNVGGIIEDSCLYINRTVHRDGKSKAVIGGKTTPASYLGEIGDNLVNIHGQSDQIKLKSAAVQRDALDRYAGAPLRSILDAYRAAHTTWTDASRQLDELRSNRAALEAEHERLLAVIAEIEKVDPIAGEDTALAATADRLTNIDEIRTNTLQAMGRISSDDFDAGDALTRTSEAIRLLSAISGYDPAIGDIVLLAETAQAALSDLNSELNSYLATIDTDSLSELNTIQERIAVLTTLKRHYGPTLDDVIATYEAAGIRVLEIDPSGDHITHLEETVTQAHAEMSALANQLTTARTDAAGRLMTAVNTELAGLAMGNASFIVHVTPSGNYARHGQDDISFLLAAHHGAEPRPLGKGASGGELSRIMLAIEVVLADPDTTPTFIFDEVDSGVGGATAIEIGKRLAQLATRAQVIVVTHLPQVAAFADNHLRVLKTSGDDYVSTDVTQLDGDGRVTELARMLSGMSDSTSARTHAQEMLEHAFTAKSSFSH
jgi:DNA repair protein RecN (Recombination protein N)